MIKVTPEDIAYTESLLLKPGQTFDDERLRFIKNFKTIDLQAVPGSGKTTALLAKLLILEKHLPLEKNRGILVLSHTNAAVNEVKNRIGHHCPKLFSHPNFVGTIQSFTDNFLAIPAYLSKYKQKPVRIDDEIYNETIGRVFHHNKKGFVIQEKKNATYYNKNFNVLHSFRFSYNKGVFSLVKSIYGEPLEIKTPNLRKEKFTKNEIDRIAEWFYKTKLKVLETGILNYDDAYLLADVILTEIPSYRGLIQNRFKYVFVDEMQDMEKHQFDLLERIFANDNCTSFYQRLGDVNQSIFSKSLDNEEIWKQRADKMFINGSHRLSRPIANIVEKFALTSTEVQGRMKNNDGFDLTIKPLLMCYDIERIADVIPIFSDEIKKLIDKGLIIPNEGNKYEAIGWRKHHDHINKICISDYWPNFKTNEKLKKIDYDTLEDYIKFIENGTQTLEANRKSILNSLNKILYIEGIRDEYSRVFTISKLIKYFKVLPSNEYDLLKLNLYNWSLAIENGAIDIVLDKIRTYIPYFLTCFSRQINYSKDFIYESSKNEKVASPDERAQYFDKNGIRVNISTVHSVKGQTHTATLYLETFFSKGAGSYESERLQNQVLGIPIKEHLDNYKGGSVDKIIQSARMVYVGFSRPTHFLCFAVESSRANKLFKEIDRNDWDVIQIKKTEVADS
ncbi:UvrD-helicase domain-containing protein [Algibacter miyuki]|uniref:DNA 3'-5' helicase II n=1 Tax=Algibacter miyuki TaxID=1306933 RepID=A0ABV5H152_9FLAO|nr:UvrD-helicase domain-containing protein [Algibacter miyuki]MDN3664081.1 UvrD-helicase domain-containing protein [Algibacter miyuki]